jgi:hypothetical protein
VLIWKTKEHRSFRDYNAWWRGAAMGLKEDLLREEQKRDAEFKSLREELWQLEERAGIAHDAERAKSGPLFPTLPSAPFGSQRRRQQIKEAQENEADFIRRRVRTLYFSVPEAEARKALIAKFREVDEKWFMNRQAEFHAAQRKLEAEKANAGYGHLIAALEGVICVAIGAAIYQVIGAIAGAVAGYFMGRAAEERSRRARATAVAEAERDAKQYEEICQEAEKGEAWFSRDEARTGVEDKPPMRVA